MRFIQILKIQMLWKVFWMYNFL